MVALGVVLSTIAWFFRWPATAIGILMGFAFVDLVLYALMPDLLACYRCGAQYRGVASEGEVARFDLETAERYRQEARRLKSAQAPPNSQ